MTEPAYSFTIPSCFDNLSLDCRIYHSKDLGQETIPEGTSRLTTKGAIVAHPYAPLGGCYDDGVVLAVTDCLLARGYIVGTFNFR